MITAPRLGSPEPADTDVHRLRTLLPAPPDAPMTAEQSERLERKLHAVMTRPDRAARVRLRLVDHAASGAVAALVAVLAIAGFAFGHQRSHPPRPLPIAASPAAARVLHSASLAAARLPVVDVRADQYVYVRSLVESNEGRYGTGPRLGVAHERQLWLSQRDVISGVGDDVIREFGQDWPIDRISPTPAGIDRPTTRWLSGLPEDPDALLARLRRDVAAAAFSASYRDTDQALFWAIGQMIGENLVPPKTESALLRALMRVDNVTTVERVTDAAGRTGVGVTRFDHQYGTQDVLIFDPNTYALLGTRSYFTDPAHPTPAGSIPERTDLFGATAVLERAVVDRRGEQPD